MIGFVNGCFDVLHYGHVQLLKAAKQRCIKVIVGLNSDESYFNLKNRQPLNNQQIRKEMLLALKYVDKVVLFDEPNVVNLLKSVAPDVWIKGSDYSLKTINKDELKTAYKLNCKIVFVPTFQKEKYSSSNFKLC